jgi:hypothetical protein
MLSPALLSADGSTILAMVPVSMQPILAARVFQQIDCAQQPLDPPTYKANLCQLAASNNDEQNLRQLQNHSVTPKELCDWAASY